MKRRKKRFLDNTELKLWIYSEIPNDGAKYAAWDLSDVPGNATNRKVADKSTTDAGAQGAERTPRCKRLFDSKRGFLRGIMTQSNKTFWRCHFNGLGQCMGLVTKKKM